MGMREITQDAIFDFFSGACGRMTSFIRTDRCSTVQHVTMRFGGITAVITTCPCGSPRGPSPGSSAPTAGKTTAPSTSSAASTTPGRRHPVQGPQREGLPAAPDPGRAWPRPSRISSSSGSGKRAGKRHGRLSGPPQKPMVDARLPAHPAHGARKEIREKAKGPHPPPRARFLHGRKGVEPALRERSGALKSPARWRPARTLLLDGPPPG